MTCDGRRRQRAAIPRLLACCSAPHEPLRLRGAGVDHLEENAVGRLEHYLIVVAATLMRELWTMPWRLEQGWHVVLAQIGYGGVYVRQRFRPDADVVCPRPVIVVVDLFGL